MDPEVNILMHALYQMRHLGHNQVMRGAVSNGEFFILVFIGDAVGEKKKKGELPEAVTVSEIAKMAEMALPAVSRTIRNLEEKGYVRRVDNKADRRQVFVERTEKGEQILKEAYENTKIRVQHLVNGLGKDDTRELIRLMQKVHDIIKEELEVTHC